MIIDIGGHLKSLERLRGFPGFSDAFVDIRVAQVKNQLPDLYRRGKPIYPAEHYDRILEMLREHLPRRIKQPSISEFGGGVGNFAVVLPHLISGARPIIFDNDSSSCTMARNRGLSVVQGDLHALDFSRTGLRGRADAVIGHAFEFTDEYDFDYGKIADQLYLHARRGAPIVFQFLSTKAARKFRAALDGKRFRIVKEHYGKGRPLVVAVRLPLRRRGKI